MESQSSLPPYGHSEPGSRFPDPPSPDRPETNRGGEFTDYPPGHPIHLFRRFLKLPPFTGLGELAGLRRVPREEPLHRPLFGAMWGAPPWQTIALWILGVSLVFTVAMSLSWLLISRYFDFINHSEFLATQIWRPILYDVPPQFLFSMPFLLSFVIAWKSRKGFDRLGMGVGESSMVATDSVPGKKAPRESVRRVIGFQIVVCGFLVGYLGGVFPTIQAMLVPSFRHSLGTSSSIIAWILTGSVVHTSGGWIGVLFHHQVLWRAEVILLNCIELTLFVACLLGPFSMRRRIVLLLLAGYAYSICETLLFRGVSAGLDLNPILAENLYGPLTMYLAYAARIAIEVLALGWVWKAFSRKIG